MALASYALPFGLRQVKLTPLLNDGTPDTANAVLLPASRTFSFKETEDFEELKGDDSTIASHGAGPIVEWDLEGGGISLDVWTILGGGAVVDSGTTPAQIRTYTKNKGAARGYFNVEGRAISDSGGDFHCVVYRCKADGDLGGEFTNGSFFLTAASGKGYGDVTTGDLYVFKHNETAAVLTA